MAPRRAAPRVTLYEAESWVYGKILYAIGPGDPEGTILKETIVNGHRALWLSGAPHVLVTLDSNGKPIAGTERPVDANTLAWEEGDVTLRVDDDRDLLFLAADEVRQAAARADLLEKNILGAHL